MAHAGVAEARLLDEVQLPVCPIVLGAGKSLFSGVTGKPWWTLSRSRAFQNDRVFLAYNCA